MPITFIIGIILVSYSLFFYFQLSTEFRMKENILDQASMLQVKDNKQIAIAVGDELNFASASLYEASQKKIDTSDPEVVSAFLQQVAATLRVNGGIALVDAQLQIIQSWGIEEASTLRPGILSESGISIDSDQTRSPEITSGYIDGKPFVFITSPTVNPGNLLIVAAIPASELLYGVQTEPYQSYFSEDGLASIKNKDAFLPVGELSGQDEEETDSLAIAISEAKSASLAGSSEKIVYMRGSDEHLLTASPVAIGDRTYWIFVTSPVAEHLSSVNEILFTQRMQTFSLLAGTSLIAVILALFLSKNLRLDREVKARTADLEQSNMIVTRQKIELERANSQLKQLDVLKDQFISIASHELKNPIQPILMYADLGRRGNVSPEKALDGIAVEAKRLKKLADDILDVSRIESGTLKYQIERVRLKPLIDELVSGARIQVSEKVNFEILMEDPSLEIDADYDRIAQVLQNIISNAIKFTSKGSIRIMAGREESGTNICIRIIDTGEGIPVDIIPTVFDKFVTKSVGDRNAHGSGLGLYISRAIVVAHGGSISAKNNSEGGAEFSVTLPIRSSVMTEQHDPKNDTDATATETS